MTETNIAYTIIGGLIVGLVILLFKNKLTAERDRQRDGEAKKRDFNAAASHFNTVVDKCLADVSDIQKVLSTVHSKSIPEIEPAMRGVHPHLDDAAKSRLDQQWQDYYKIPREQLDVKYGRSPLTGNTTPLFDNRNDLSKMLKNMKDIIRNDT